MDFQTGELVASLSDIRLVSGTRTAAQWLMGSLLTERGTVPFFPLTYGSYFKSRMGAITDELEIAELIRTAAEGHDRIIDVSDVVVERSPTNNEYLTVSFSVTMDWGERIVFRKVNLG